MAENEFDDDLLGEYLEKLGELQSLYTGYLEDPANKTLPKLVMGPEQVKVFDFLVYIPGQVEGVFRTLFDTLDVVARIPGQERQALQLADFLQEHAVLLNPQKSLSLRKDIRSARRSAFFTYRSLLLGDDIGKKSRSQLFENVEELLLWADSTQRKDLIEERDKLKTMEISSPIMALIVGGFAMILVLAIAASRVFF